MRLLLGCDLGGVAAVLAVLEAMRGTQTVQTFGCARKALLFEQTDPVCGGSLTESSMAAICKQCLMTLCNFCHDSEENRLRVGHSGCELVVSVLLGLASHADIAEFGCALLNNLSHSVENKGRLSEAHAVELLLGLLKQHSREPKVLEYACMASFNLCSNPIAKQRFVDLQAQEAVERVLSLHPSQSKLVLEARDVLAKIVMSSYGSCVRGHEACTIA